MNKDNVTLQTPLRGDLSTNDPPRQFLMGYGSMDGENISFYQRRDTATTENNASSKRTLFSNKHDVPQAGICLVFQSINEYYYLSIDGDELVAHRNIGLTKKQYNETNEKNYFSRKENLVKYFKESDIHYTIVESTDKEKSFFYVIIAISVETASKWADKLNVDLEISPRGAVKVGRKLNLKLAERYVNNCNYN